MRMPPELLLVIMAIFTATGQMLLKKGTVKIIRGSGLRRFLLSLIDPSIFAGLFLALSAPLLYIRALRSLPLSTAFMYNSLSHLLVFLAGHLILKERANFLHRLGLSLIIAGFLYPGIMGGGI